VAFQFKVVKPKIASFFSGNPTNAMYATSLLGRINRNFAFVI
jgi:hypothetical protein